LNRELSSIIYLVMFLSLGGCAWPVDRPEPYDSSKFANIQIGESSRNQVVSIFGQPDVILNGGEFWIYGKTRMIIYDMAGPGIHDFQSLLVGFDNDVVNSYEVLEDIHGCWSTGLCLVLGWDNHPSKDKPASLDRERTAIVSQRDDDRRAKMFEIQEDQCAVYFFAAYNFFVGLGYTTITIGSVKDEPLPHKGYLRLRVPLGSHKVLADDHVFNFDCESSDLMFFEIDHYMGLGEAKLKMNRVNEEAGKAAIMKRNLLLTW
jgi:hypothetical protein